MTREAQPDVLGLDSLTRYDIDLSIGLESLTISGRQTMTYTNNSPDVLEELYFNLFPNSSRFAGSIEIGEVEVDGRPQAFEYERQATVAKVPLPDPLAPGETTTVELDFTARVPHVEKNYYLVFVMAHGVLSLGDWHPMVAVYDDQGWNLEYPEGTVGEIVFSESAFYTVRLTLPQVPGLEVIATGVEAEHTIGPDGGETFVYYSGPARDFHLVISDRYESTTNNVAETTISSYYWPEHEKCGREALGFAARALTLYNDLFGPYPFTELDLAEADLWPWAIEWPGLILVGEPLYADPIEACGEWHVVHEVAHQWWYSVVGNDQVDEPWLDEALANYSTLLYYEMVHDPQTAAAALEEHIQQPYSGYVQAYGDGIVSGRTADYTRASYYPLVYAKGALFFDALRREMGDEDFFAGLQSYYVHCKYRVATPENLLATMEEAHGQPLEEFFQRWVFSAQGT
jgi:aminopeptidase N